MALGAQLPIRLEPDIQEQLEAIAEQCGTNKSALIRLLAKTFVEQVVSAKGEVHLPPNWHEWSRGLPAADGRSTKARAARGAGRRGRVPAQGAVAPPSSKPASAAASLLARHTPSVPRRGEG